MEYKNIFIELVNTDVSDNTIKNNFLKVMEKINPYTSSSTINIIQMNGFTIYNELFSKYYLLVQKYCNEELDEFGNTLIHILSIINSGEKLLLKIKDHVIDWNKNGVNKSGSLYPPIIKAARYGKLNNFLFFYNMLPKEEIFRDYNYFSGNNNILISACANPDMRILKFIIKNGFQFKGDQAKLTLSNSLKNIFLDHIPSKYQLRRLKLLSTIKELELTKSISDIIFSCSYDCKILKTIFKYYKTDITTDPNIYSKIISTVNYKLEHEYSANKENDIKEVFSYFITNKIEKNLLVFNYINYTRCINNKIFDILKKSLPSEVESIINSTDPYKMMELLTAVFEQFHRYSNDSWSDSNENTICGCCGGDLQACTYKTVNYISSHIVFKHQECIQQLLHHFTSNNGWGGTQNIHTKIVTLIILFSKCSIDINKLKINDDCKKIINSALKLKSFLKGIIYKKLKDKKKKFSLLYGPVLNSIVTFSPEYHIPVLSKGSILFNSNKQRMITHKFPTNIDPCHLVFQDTKDCFIKEKADGVFSISLPLEYYPATEKLSNIEIKGEYIEELNIYFVFDINIPNLNIEERYNYIRGLHPYTKEYLSTTSCKQIETVDEFIVKLEQERIILDKFINESKTDLLSTSGKDINTSLWYPKAAWKTKPNSKLLYELTALLFFGKGTENYNRIINNGIFPIDGIIVQPLSGDTESKIKPLEHLTIDVLWNGIKWLSREKKEVDINSSDINPVKNQIWRCYWIDNNWIPREIRWDKKLSNPQWIIDSLERFHKNPWNPNELLEMSNPYYMIRGKISNNLISIFKKQRNLQSKFFEDLNLDRGKKWLDIGCGRGGSINNINNYIPLKYVGIDSDPLCIGEITNRWGGESDFFHYLLHDMNDPNLNYKFNSLDVFNDKFDYILCNFSIHFASISELTWNLWLDKINKRSKKGTVIMFNFLDVKKLKTEFDGYYKFDDSSYLKITNMDLEHTYVETYFSWSHIKSIKEIIFDESKYIKTFEDNRWKLLRKLNIDETGLPSLYKWLAFIKV